MFIVINIEAGVCLGIGVDSFFRVFLATPSYSEMQTRDETRSKASAPVRI
jgi:hypothetical protein